MELDFKTYKLLMSKLQDYKMLFVCCKIFIVIRLLWDRLHILLAINQS